MNGVLYYLQWGGGVESMHRGPAHGPVALRCQPGESIELSELGGELCKAHFFHGSDVLWDLLFVVPSPPPPSPFSVYASLATLWPILLHKRQQLTTTIFDLDSAAVVKVLIFLFFFSRFPIDGASSL